MAQNRTQHVAQDAAQDTGQVKGDGWNNTLFQRENLEETCKFSPIPWDGEDTIFMTKQRSLSMKLEFWRPVAVKAISDLVDQVRSLAGISFMGFLGISSKHF